MRKLLMVLAAGALGGLANSLVVWQFGVLGLNQALGVAIAPALTPEWLYPRLVWGGIWGVLFILPILNSQLLAKSFILSLFPTAAQLFLVFPYQTQYGIAGMGLGALTPLLVVFFNWVWGLTAAILLRIAR